MEVKVAITTQDSFPGVVIATLDNAVLTHIINRGSNAVGSSLLKSKFIPSKLIGMLFALFENSCVVKKTKSVDFAVAGGEVLLGWSSS
jgi:hypothetical protein